MTFDFTRMLLGGVVLALSATSANATLLNTTGQNLVATGNSVSASFLHKNAGDISLLLLSINGGPQLFLFDSLTFHDGDTLNTATSPGASLLFTLRDLSMPNSFPTGAASTNVNYAVFDGSIPHLNNALFTGGEFLSPAAVTAVNALGAGAMIVAFEDRPLPSSDHDFNDLVFGFNNVVGCTADHACGTPIPLAVDAVPEPGAVGLIAAALFALVGVWFGRRPSRA